MGIFTSRAERCPKCFKVVIVDGGMVSAHDCTPHFNKEGEKIEKILSDVDMERKNKADTADR